MTTAPPASRSRSGGGGGYTPNGVVTLTTDFGDADGYVGAMKGVMLAAAPDLKLCDIAHAMPAQDLVHAAFVVRAACLRFPAGTTHLVVVDPGVGTPRAPIVAVAGGHAFVAPDNGVLSLALTDVAARPEGGGHGAPIVRRIAASHHLPTERSATFHGRDVFAPTAAALASGARRLADVGPRHELIGTLPLPTAAQATERGVAGTITRADRFGNLITNIPRSALASLPGPCTVHAARTALEMPVTRTYGDVAPGAAAALIGGDDWLELAVRDGDAATRLGLRPGDAVEVRGGDEPPTT